MPRGKVRRKVQSRSLRVARRIRKERKFTFK